MPVIDFHTHIFPPHILAQRRSYQQRDNWFGQLYADPKAKMVTADELVAAMDAAGVDKSVTFGFSWADQGLCREANDYVLESVSRWPDRLIGFALVNPVAPGAAAEVERCLHRGLSGLGELMPDGQGYALDAAQLDEVIRLMTHWRRPVLIHAGEPVGHAYAGKSQSTLQPFYQLALRHPEATLVAAHWGGGLFFYELMPEVQKALRHVYYDTAASLYLYRDDIFALAERIVPNKVLFATDYPLIGQEHFLRRVRAAQVQADTLQAMLGDNAAQVLWRE